ncbi:hypothetical protein RCG23_24745 [Neobacillus sp. PS3-34]|uniref:hypothetical protein n=1 Tax=Neobacillus sp. PS3-34 TaxID=3070678 RepID=UPI0027E163AE|nr:hypothetical protein [Neobacillus sp. PS3-34]WML48408.1 hypothetical protein RCG23_24745 [Neobacillus sp. PS3-34]
MKLIAGIILIFMSVVHIIYGEKQPINELKKLNADNILIGSFRTMSLQGGLLLLAVGVVEIMVYSGIIALSGFAAFIPVGIICLNVLSVLIVATVKHQELFKAIIPQLIIFAIIITLQLVSVI